MVRACRRPRETMILSLVFHGEKEKKKKALKMSLSIPRATKPKERIRTMNNEIFHRQR
jgi:hypothetical protein